MPPDALIATWLTYLPVIVKRFVSPTSALQLVKRPLQPVGKLPLMLEYFATAVFAHLCSSHIILILRNRYSSQYPNDRYYDHQIY